MNTEEVLAERGRPYGLSARQVEVADRMGMTMTRYSALARLATQPIRVEDLNAVIGQIRDDEAKEREAARAARLGLDEAA